MGRFYRKMKVEITMELKEECKNHPDLGKLSDEMFQSLDQIIKGKYGDFRLVKRSYTKEWVSKGELTYVKMNIELYPNKECLDEKILED